MANKTKKNKGGQKTPDKVETEPPTNDDSHLENPSPSDEQPTSDEQPIEETETLYPCRSNAPRKRFCNQRSRYSTH